MKLPVLGSRRGTLQQPQRFPIFGRLRDLSQGPKHEAQVARPTLVQLWDSFHWQTPGINSMDIQTPKFSRRCRSRVDQFLLLRALLWDPKHENTYVHNYPLLFLAHALWETPWDIPGKQGTVTLHMMRHTYSPCLLWPGATTEHTGHRSTSS